ncbi:MAG: hypothetical protein PUD40_04705 [Bacteroidales bacterium]|nr:hypothetical protein [Bacteroidales bacterium]
MSDGKADDWANQGAETGAGRKMLGKGSPSADAAAGRAGQMLKRERPHLLFAEKCSIFALAKEEAIRYERLPPFLSPAYAQNYPALAKNYKALGFF